ncbi:hypothetical protein [uncultured Aliiroseovarius sp.]|uniref:hypothetical protein n=1 Tax=uncultured Aliiroseovarius sp. TaxID=1658783 RepID=UPI0025956BC3|nr:hypothetical protein [uncultured Aliiroseovarius sp.]
MWTLPEAPEIVVSFGTLLAGCAAIWGAYSAHRGIDTWKTQRVWDTNRDLSQRALLCLTKRRKAFRGVRHPFMSAGEMVAAYGEYNSLDEQKSYEAQTAAYGIRWEALQNARSEFDAILMEAEVLWDENLAALEQRVASIEAKLRINLELELRELDPRKRHQISPSIDPNRRMEVYGLPNDDADNEYTVEFNALAEPFKRRLDKHV